MNVCEFTDLRNPNFQSENVSAKIVTKPEILTKYFQVTAPIDIYLKANDDILDKTQINLAKVAEIDPKLITKKKFSEEIFVSFQNSDSAKLCLVLSLECIGKIEDMDENITEEFDETNMFKPGQFDETNITEDNSEIPEKDHFDSTHVTDFGHLEDTKATKTQIESLKSIPNSNFDSVNLKNVIAKKNENDEISELKKVSQKTVLELEEWKWRQKQKFKQEVR